MALKFHPDKLEDADDKSGHMFQKVLTAYNILRDPKRRKIYDRTGEVSTKDPSAVDQFVEAYQYYRNKFPELREKDICSFEGKYRFSAEEEVDLLDFFEEHRGDVTNILEHVILSRNSDVPRFLEFFDRVLQEEPHKSRLGGWRKTFALTRGKIRKLTRKEAKQASKIKKDRMASLQQAILLKNRNRGNDFLENLERAFMEESSETRERVLKDKTTGANRGKRARAGLIKTEKPRVKRKKVQKGSPNN